MSSVMNLTPCVAVEESVMTPREIVSELDQYVIGQGEAKRAVANALRNRWRRSQLPEDLRREITPKNILMIGPTGVGKTEIARRLAKLVHAPFVKVEATKFTEVGYVGRDVDSIVRDLADVAIKQTRERALKRVKLRAHEMAEDQLVDLLLPIDQDAALSDDEREIAEEKRDKARSFLRRQLKNGELDHKEVEIAMRSHTPSVEILGPPGMEELMGHMQSMMDQVSSKKTNKRRVPVPEALAYLTDEAASGLINEDEIKSQAIDAAEQNGIVFIDEIDKIARRAEHGGDVSREGVQRDLLPLVEGCTVTTKYGAIKTDHILFIASGAFHLSKPSDLVPELQGRLPIRVELNALTIDDFERILTEPNASLTEQYVALLGTENLQLRFTPCGIRRLAEIACQVNNTAENIGARRLHTLLERLLEQLSFESPDKSGTEVSIDQDYVESKLANLAKDEDLSRSIL